MELLINIFRIFFFLIAFGQTCNYKNVNNSLLHTQIHSILEYFTLQRFNNTVEDNIHQCEIHMENRNTYSKYLRIHLP